jgi:hypothetical protein
MIRKDDRERDKLEIDKYVKNRELELKYGVQLNEIALNAEIERDRNAQMQMQTGMPPQ